MRNKYLFPAMMVCLFLACSQKQKRRVIDVSGNSYFSVTQFANDQFRTFWGQPFTLQKFVTENGKTDSSLVSAYELDWAAALKPFFDADISDPRLVGKYNFSEVKDDATVSKTYFYEAKEKELFVRTLQIVTDPFTDKIKAIFIETEKSGRTQKLYYKPIKVIQIQEYESSFLGKDKNLRIEYRFLN